MFEFDSKKSASNEKKHGINFIDAQLLWAVPHVSLELKFTEKSRFLLISKIPSGCWAAIFTKRGKKIRIISVRRARKNEKEFFYGKK
jgi:uncharacterized DUF497 family protein